MDTSAMLDLYDAIAPLLDGGTSVDTFFQMNVGAELKDPPKCDYVFV